ncbi:spore germination protein [Petroclostridium sp. X23]|uniref:spore germination protein n=1 Tax=Petroclostridium sp. X23 TaxID=3045146 RepID=UPI0024AC8CBE|nr:spore germination protein [Petroclostridium sp. X23]WHH61620.1 spore germination protein [Petroclostridium sp. X23]
MKYVDGAMSMTRFLKKIIRKGQDRGRRQDEESKKVEHLKTLVLSEDLDKNIKQIEKYMGNSFDVKSRKFKVNGQNISAAVIFIDNLTKEDLILEHIIKPLTIESAVITDGKETKINFERIKDSMISTGTVQEVWSFDDIILAVLSGDTFLAVQGYDKGLIISSKGYAGRSIEEPATEPSVKGPKEGFIEQLKDNMGLIRKKLRDPNLSFEAYKIGRRSKGNVVLVYIRGIVKPEIVDEVRNRVKSIDTDQHGDAARIEQLISDRPHSIFPLVQLTERPDKVVSSILEGRVGIIVEGSPAVLLVPTTYPMLLQSVDDYYERWIISSVIRMSRYVAVFISALLPAIYVALTSFHPGLIPTNLALSIAGTRAGVPFPAFIEAVLMEATLELLQEAGIRLPKVVGQTVSIVGGLVIGQAAVQAGVISPIMVIVIAITAIASFSIPDYSLNLATRILRIPFMLLGTTFGAFGIGMGMIYLVGYQCSLKSFGVRYMEPLTPYRIRDWKDLFIRGPQQVMGKRPELLTPEDTQRQIIRKGEK